MSTRTTARRNRLQGGFSLIITLLALIIISFAAVALLRSTDTSTLIAGNLSFKKTALGASDAAVETAITFMNSNTGGGFLYLNQPASGYYASTAENCDLTGSSTPSNANDDVAWSNASPNGSCNLTALTVTPAGVPAGYAVSYVINRLCSAEGDPSAILAADGLTTMTCSRVTGVVSDGSTKTGGFYGNTPLSGSAQIYYRITVRVTGPRNTVRYLQTFVTL